MRAVAANKHVVFLNLPTGSDESEAEVPVFRRMLLPRLPALLQLGR